MILTPHVVETRARIRRWVPWLVGIAILTVVATRVPYSAFRGALDHGHHVTLALVDFGVILVTLASDSFSTWVGLIALRLRRPLRMVFLVRGATYVLFLINYAVGQGGFGYYLHRTGVSALRSVGATLFLIGINLGTLLVVTAIVWPFVAVDAPSLAWIVYGGCAALGGYLVVIAIAPRWLSSRELFAPLFDAGVRGHVVALAARALPAIVIVLGYWVAMRAWDIPLPFGIGVATLPVVVVASALPIAPAGLGTTQAALVYLFAAYTTGATSDDRHAAMLAFAIVHFVYTSLAVIVVGFVCLPFARRAGAIPT